MAPNDVVAFLRELQDRVEAKAGGKWTVSFHLPQDETGQMRLGVFRVKSESADLSFLEDVDTTPNGDLTSEIERIADAAARLMTSRAQ